ncbi:MAG: FGGY-family carbohydrate kinase, partial [Planctomycetota bacterium]
LSSGTWSLLGVELDQPVINEEALTANFTNEIGFGHSVRLLKNLSGLFILQECRRVWKEDGRDYDYGELARQAQDAPPLRSLIRPDADVFATVGDMPTRVVEFCKQTGQPVPETPGQFTRCIYESLALLYGETIRTLEAVAGTQIKKLNIVGGGSQSALLNQLAADATGLSVEAGPVEATGLGNIGVQAIAAGQLRDLDDLRDLVRRSFDTQTYTPTAGPITEAAARFLSLKTK